MEPYETRKEARPPTRYLSEGFPRFSPVDSGPSLTRQVGIEPAFCFVTWQNSSIGKMEGLSANAEARGGAREKTRRLTWCGLDWLKRFSIYIYQALEESIVGIETNGPNEESRFRH